MGIRYRTTFLRLVSHTGWILLAQGWAVQSGSARQRPVTVLQATSLEAASSVGSVSSDDARFEDFVEYLIAKQSAIIDLIEKKEEGSATFSRDAWGIFEASSDDENSNSSSNPSGGLTRVLQGGNIIEKGACSLTVIRQGTLSEERAATIRARQDQTVSIQQGDTYSAAALSMVLHSRSPHVPTFRSDVRIFCVKSGEDTLAWLGGGADLTPYYLYDDNISFFHSLYRDLCDRHATNDPNLSYAALKQGCDDYFYLPARSEHRGTGGIFFDDLTVTADSLAFTKGVVDTWMPSWFPIVDQRNNIPATDKQRQWQLLRRGRYLEFNLLYDRGVKFGLANANPRVEGIMVSAPPLIAFEYNHVVESGSEEDRLLQILKNPKEWV
jgi:coproporphyrinogen III oxidase